MDLGLVLQNDPPAWRVVDLMRRAETLGFSHGWTFDSHVLWQEPYVVYSQILAATHRMVVGPMVTNPGTRDWTVIASQHATLNDMFGERTVCGIGRGDSAVRTLSGKPTTLQTLREATHVIRELGNGRAVEHRGTMIRLPWASRSALEVWIGVWLGLVGGRSGMGGVSGCRRDGQADSRHPGGPPRGLRVDAR